jgi:hypothetical protein
MFTFLSDHRHVDVWCWKSAGTVVAQLRVSRQKKSRKEEDEKEVFIS